MQLFAKTLDPDIFNVVFDEALLEEAEREPDHSEVLRLWHPSKPLAVIGRSSPWQTEVNHAFCQQENIPVVRRCSGGQSIVTGPGCLMYAVLLDYRRRPELRMLDAAHRFVMTKMQSALQTIGIQSLIEGTSDLTVNGRKVSGNAMRCKKNWFIYHGTMICDMDIRVIENCLGAPFRQPEYRQQRSHQDFLAQLNTTPAKLSAAIIETWPTSGKFQLSDRLEAETAKLFETKYSTDVWNQKV
jgi:lipoate-protein ligase A